MQDPREGPGKPRPARAAEGDRGTSQSERRGVAEEAIMENPTGSLGPAGGLGGSENETAKSPRQFVVSVMSLSGSHRALSCLPPAPHTHT